MTNIKIDAEGEKIKVFSPYHEAFPRAARKLGGRWLSSEKAWAFDPRDEDRVRALCRKVYGTDGRDDRTVDVRLTLARAAGCDALDAFLLGRQIARAFDRDSGARTGEGVVVVAGGFFSTGSRKHPRLGCRKETVIEIRDVPALLVQEAFESDGWCERSQPIEVVGAEVVRGIEEDPRVAQARALATDLKSLLDQIGDEALRTEVRGML